MLLFLLLSLSQITFSLRTQHIYNSHSSRLCPFKPLPLRSYDEKFDLGGILLCLEPTSKTTTINDPTAGMNADEILNYMSNVGGGMCGYPEVIRTSIGLGLNLSLIVFGLFTVSYVILSLTNFVLEKQVTDAVKSAETYDRIVRTKMPPAKRGPNLADIAEEMSLPYMANTGNKIINDAIAAITRSSAPPGTVTSEEATIIDGDGAKTNNDASNRQARRLKARINKKEK
mmetsp:Transcript_8658/g.12915  ORF Transcript_8658/g.12915 Transcript_8658/m.12915 type:complete len:229 (-) Transcript_8658:71-757(-)